MKAIVLAAGKGSRLQSGESELPKALRLLNGRPLIHYVLENLDFIPKEDVAIVVGFLKEKVVTAVGGGYRYVEQKQLDGTAKATLCAKSIFGNYSGPILVCYCDMPFLRRETYREMVEKHIESGAGNTLLAGRDEPIPPYGRLIFEGGRLVDVVEDSACDAQQKKIADVNVGIQVLKSPEMWGWLSEIDNQNPREEYYLTGVVGVLARRNIAQAVVTLGNPVEMKGVNTMGDLRRAEEIIRNTQRF